NTPPYCPPVSSSRSIRRYANTRERRKSGLTGPYTAIGRRNRCQGVISWCLRVLGRSLTFETGRPKQDERRECEGTSSGGEWPPRQHVADQPEKARCLDNAPEDYRRRSRLHCHPVRFGRFVKTPRRNLGAQDRSRHD